MPPPAAPYRIVELKGRDPKAAATLAAALALGATDHGVLHQRETYFGARSGRLKLREQEPGGAQLIARARAAVAVHLCGPEGIRHTTTVGELLPLAFGAGSLPR